MPDDTPPAADVVARLLEICALGSATLARRGTLQREVVRGYDEAKARLLPRAHPTPVEPAIPGGMLEALCIAGAMGRDTSALDSHYTRAMPALLARQLYAAQVPEEPLFTARLGLSRMPRLAAALEGLFARVADAGLSCEQALGGATPRALIDARPTLGALYSGCHFGRSMPMLYAAPGDVAAMPARSGKRSEQTGEQSVEEWIDARYAGPLAHELAHLQPLDPALVPAPGNLHEALAAWLGSEAFPEQLWPRARSSADDPGGLDALPGGAFFASVGGWIARALGERDAIRVQAGALGLSDALGPACASALRLYGWLPYLETSAPHLLADTFAPARWWKLIDLHRDPALAEALEEKLVRPLLEAPPPAPGVRLVSRWNEFLDALEWQELPAWREPASAEDEKLALRACRALAVRAVRQGGSFRAERAEPPAWTETATSAPVPPASAKGLSSPRRFGEGPLRLDVRSGLLRAAFGAPDAVGAPAVHPVPPAICAAFQRAGLDEVLATPEGLPPRDGLHTN